MTMVVWMLLVIHSGSSNYGNIYSKDFSTKESCLFAKQQLEVLRKSHEGYTEFSSQCVRVEVPRLN